MKKQSINISYNQFFKYLELRRFIRTHGQGTYEDISMDRGPTGGHQHGQRTYGRTSAWTEGLQERELFQDTLDPELSYWLCFQTERIAALSQEEGF